MKFLPYLYSNSFNNAFILTFSTLDSFAVVENFFRNLDRFNIFGILFYFIFLSESARFY